jgi:dihydrolipoamide dehydrogenase
LADSSSAFDVVVIGGGPGGYVAAIRAAQVGLRTAMIDKSPLPGGTCLHWGCIPTKAMLHTAEVLEAAKHGEKFGVAAAGVSLDLERMHAYKNGVVTQMAKGVEGLLKRNGVESIRGFGRLAWPGRVEVLEENRVVRTIETRNVILATGSAVRPLPGLDFDGARIISSDEALHLKKVPASMIVLGAGAVGMEFASVYSRFGSQVTVLELLPRALPLEDEDVSTEIARAFKKRGIAIATDTRVEKAERKEGGITVTAAQQGKPATFAAEVVLVAVGRRPLSEGIGLEKTKVKIERGFVQVDGMMRTAEPGIYAIGDLVPTQALAHVASHEGTIAAEAIAGLRPHPINYDRVPACTYCDPEVASVGLTEAEARRRGIEVRTGRLPFGAIGKAAILGETGGFVKIVADAKLDEVLGVHIIGPRVTELIAEATLGLELETTGEAMIHAIHPHPTLSEAMGEAAMALHGRALHFFQDAARAMAAARAR